MTHAEVLEPQQTTAPATILDGRWAQFADTFAAIAPELHTTARYIVGLQDAPDAVQDAAASTFKALDRFKDRGEHSMRGLLFTAVRNASLNIASRRTMRERRTPLMSSPEHLDCSLKMADTSLSDYAARAFSPRIREALAELSPEHRDVLVQVYAEGTPLKEYAESLGIRYGTALSRSARAREALKSLLAPPEQGEAQ